MGGREGEITNLSLLDSLTFWFKLLLTQQKLGHVHIGNAIWTANGQEGLSAQFYYSVSQPC